MTSSAAGSLGAFIKKQNEAAAPEPQQSAAALPADRDFDADMKAAIQASQLQEEASAKPAAAQQSKSARAKSVLATSQVMSSSAAGALSGLIAAKAAARPSAIPEESQVAEESAPAVLADSPSQEAPKPKRSGQSKSVMVTSSAMTSSAAGALGAVLAQGSSATTAPAPAAQEAAAAIGREAEFPVRPRTANDGKSALATSTAMTSSAAAALGGLSTSRPAKDANYTAPPSRPSLVGTSGAGILELPEREPPVARQEPKDGVQGDASASAAKAKPKARARGGQAQTVITGLNTTSSSASALLMGQLSASAKQRPGKVS